MQWVSDPLHRAQAGGTDSGPAHRTGLWVKTSLRSRRTLSASISPSPSFGSFFSEFSLPRKRGGPGGAEGRPPSSALSAGLAGSAWFRYNGNEDEWRSVLIVTRERDYDVDAPCAKGDRRSYRGEIERRSKGGPKTDRTVTFRAVDLALPHSMIECVAAWQLVEFSLAAQKSRRSEEEWVGGVVW